MNNQQVEAELKLKKSADNHIDGYHMMGTKAYHKLGDLSRDEFDICFIYNETDKFYVGQWIFGYGFFDVLFPKETTRDITKEEFTRYNDKQMAINSSAIGKLNVKIRK